MAEKILFEIVVDAQFDDLVRLETEMEKLRKEQKEVAKESGKNSKQFQANKVALKELGAQHREASKQIKVNRTESKKLGTSYNDLTAQNRKLSAALRQLSDPLGKNSKEFNRISGRINKNTNQLKQLDSAMGRSQRNVGNYGSGLKGLGGSFIGAAAGAAGLIGGAELIIRGFTKLVSKTNELIKLNNKVKTTFKVTGDEAKKLTTDISAIADAFDQDYNIVLQSANAVSKELGISAERSLELIEEGFKKGSNNTGEFLDILKEYPAQFRAAGIDAETTFSIINQQVTEGIYSDKGVDAIKEGGLRLRENTKAVQDALAPLDDSIQKQIQQEVAAGNSFKAIQLVSEALNDSSLTASQTQAIIADVFGGAGEDAGIRYLKSLKDIDSNLDGVKNQTTSLEDANLELSKSFNNLILGLEDSNNLFTDISAIIVQDLSVALRVLGGDLEASNDKFSILTLFLTNLKTSFTVLKSTIKLLLLPLQVAFDLFGRIAVKMGLTDDAAGGLKQTLIDVQDVFIRLPQIIDIVVDSIIFSFKQVVNVIRDVASLLGEAFNIKKIISGDLSGVVNATNKLTKTFSDAFNKGIGDIPDQISDLFKGDGARTIEKAVKDSGKSAGKSLADGIAEGFVASRGKIEQSIERDLKEIEDSQKKRQIARIPKDEQDRIQVELDEIEKGELEKEERRKELRQQLTAASFEVAQETADALFAQALANNERQKQFDIDQLEIKSQGQEDRLQAQFDAGLISQEEFDNNRLVLEQKTAAKREQIERAAFNKQKDLQTKQALVNTALAITNALATTIPFTPAALIAAGVAAASGAIQVAAIRSQQFAEGGMIQGASHAEGGVPMLVGGSTPIEAEGGEAIINKKSTALFTPLLSAINQAGGGVPIMEKGGYIPKFQTGGLVSGPGTSTLDLDRMATQIVEGINDKKVINVASETIGVASNAQSIENEFTLE